ncbi:MAG: polymer-forming cytoskeletal protein [Treponemataceae bacterium]|nr:polymer-forming cytoskeletal protein [Treponemataceae bacterium]
MFETKDADFFELEEEDFDTMLASDINFRGTVKFSKPFIICGCITGSIDATSDLFIDTDAVVCANITASRVLVRGKVEGNITAQKMVFVANGGSVSGDITAEQVVLEPGSDFTGRCCMIKA